MPTWREPSDASAACSDNSRSLGGAGRLCCLVVLFRFRWRGINPNPEERLNGSLERGYFFTQRPELSSLLVNALIQTYTQLLDIRSQPDKQADNKPGQCNKGQPFVHGSKYSIVCNSGDTKMYGVRSHIAIVMMVRPLDLDERGGPGDRIRSGAYRQRGIQLQARRGHRRNTRLSPQRIPRGPWRRIHPSPACRRR